MNKSRQDVPFYLPSSYTSPRDTSLLQNLPQQSTVDNEYGFEFSSDQCEEGSMTIYKSSRTDMVKPIH